MTVYQTNNSDFISGVTSGIWKKANREIMWKIFAFVLCIFMISLLCILKCIHAFFINYYLCMYFYKCYS